MLKQEDLDMITSMASALTSMSDDLNTLLSRVEAGDDEDKHLSDGDVVEGRELVGETPSSAARIIKLELGL